MIIIAKNWLTNLIIGEPKYDTQTYTNVLKLIL